MRPIIFNEDVVLPYFSIMRTVKVLNDWINSLKSIESLRIISELLCSWLIRPLSEVVKAENTQESNTSCEPQPGAGASYWG